jgi:hypothetical protein
MRHMLKALGFWIWGLIAVSIAVSVVPLGYRLAALWRLHDVSAPSDPIAPSGTAPTQSPNNTGFQPGAKVWKPWQPHRQRTRMPTDGSHR